MTNTPSMGALESLATLRAQLLEALETVNTMQSQLETRTPVDLGFPQTEGSDLHQDPPPADDLPS